MGKFVFPFFDYEGKGYKGIFYVPSDPKLKIDDKYNKMDFTIDDGRITRRIAKKILGKRIEDDPYYYSDVKRERYTNSVNLAYLLALLNLSIPMKLKIKGDIWYTGTFEDKSSGPVLISVVESHFFLKVEEFIEYKDDMLFVVPTNNIQDSVCKKLCQEKKIDIINLDDFKKINSNQLSSKKRILGIDDDELYQLIEIIFDYKYKEKRKFFPGSNPISNVVMIIVLIITGIYYSIHLNRELLNITIKKEANVFYKALKNYFQHTTPPIYCNKYHPPPGLNLNPNIYYTGTFFLLNEQQITGKIAFSHKASNIWFILNANGSIEKMHSLPKNIIDDKIDVYDLTAKIEAEKLYYAIKQTSHKKESFTVSPEKLPINFIQNQNIIFKGQVSKKNNGELTGQMSVSHKLSHTTYYLSADGKLTTSQINTTKTIEDMTFKWLPGGCFEMGCQPSSDYTCTKFENKLHMVCLNGFWMSQTETTQGQWQKIMNKNPSVFKRCGQDCPVESVRWNDVQFYIDQLNQTIKANGRFRLPTETEWEYACTSCGMVQNNQKNRSRKTYPGCQFGMNEAGLCDMTGNVLEMCQDTFFKTDRNHQLMHQFISHEGTNKVLRGSDYSSPLIFSPCNHRTSFYQDAKGGNVGFRLVWDLR